MNSLIGTPHHICYCSIVWLAGLDSADPAVDKGDVPDELIVAEGVDPFIDLYRNWLSKHGANSLTSEFRVRIVGIRRSAAPQQLELGKPGIDFLRITVASLYIV